LFTVQGFLRGTVAQVFSVMGVVVGVWAFLWVARWLGGHWQGAQPAWIYAVLRWIVAALGGLAVSSLLQLWGERLGQAARSSPVGWLDRGGGLAVGATVGLFTAALVIMASLLAPGPRALAGQVARSRAASPLMMEAARACSISVRFVPEGIWLEERFLQARRRVEEAAPGRNSRRPRRS